MATPVKTRVDIGNNYTLCGDDECVWIEQTCFSEAGRPYTRRYSGYYRTYEQLFANFIECHFRKTEVKDTADILKQINIAETEAREMAAKLGKELDAKGAKK